MLAQEVIRQKREGNELTDKEISWFITEMTQDKISEGQIAAFAMATFIKGMSVRERISLTKSMRDSGRRLDWNLSGPIIDKHSTGGVGDCVSLLLAPALAACGGFVPMISGRGLGHTGGTLDKLDSIPGYNTTPDVELLKKVVARIGCAIVGQTEEIAPADKRLYSVRDVTATIESIDLITASILSKKLAAGLDALVLDIKFGNGAFMETKSQAKKLANSLVNVGNGLNCKTSAILSDMSEPLCSSVGNALEMIKVISILKGQAKEERLLEVV
jgi:thymidine phosphorylase